MTTSWNALTRNWCGRRGFDGLAGVEAPDMPGDLRRAGDDPDHGGAGQQGERLAQMGVRDGVQVAVERHVGLFAGRDAVGSRCQRDPPAAGGAGEARDRVSTAWRSTTRQGNVPSRPARPPKSIPAGVGELRSRRWLGGDWGVRTAGRADWAGCEGWFSCGSSDFGLFPITLSRANPSPSASLRSAAPSFGWAGESLRAKAGRRNFLELPRRQN